VRVAETPERSVDDLTRDEARTEVEALTSRILELRDAYYSRDTVLDDDATYDALVRRLELIEHVFPELQSQDSPTQTVGGRAETTLFAPVEHAERMLSLDNVFSADEFAEWAAKVERDAGRSVRWLCELKIDGLALNLRYERGQLVTAATRGDGRVGEDVTENVAAVEGIPQRLAGDAAELPDLVEVRGEVFIPKAAFDELNALQREAGEREFANPRNAASGSLRQKAEGKNAEQLARICGNVGVTAHDQRTRRVDRDHARQEDEVAAPGPGGIAGQRAGDVGHGRAFQSRCSIVPTRSRNRARSASVRWFMP
jgi:DNA ligase (NAD+)